MEHTGVSELTRDLRAWRTRVPSGGALEFRDRMVESAGAEGTDLLIARADMVFGMQHIRSALYHARKAISERRNSSDSLAMETLLYLSAERQLGRAISKMGVEKATECVVVAYLGGKTINKSRDWEELPETEEVSTEKLLKFGISEREIQTVDRQKSIELVLERVGSVDVLKK